VTEALPRTRIVIAETGIDGRDASGWLVANALRAAGYEVVFSRGLRAPERIVAAVVEHDATILGLSCQSGSLSSMVPRIIDLLAADRFGDTALVVGGPMSDDEVFALETMGVRAVFTPSWSLDDIVDAVDQVASLYGYAEASAFPGDRVPPALQPAP
jgi:methylmalonyl-CoA mutase cobalamin-binding domain/chain